MIPAERRGTKRGSTCRDPVEFPEQRRKKEFPSFFLTEGGESSPAREENWGN